MRWQPSKRPSGSLLILTNNANAETAPALALALEQHLIHTALDKFKTEREGETKSIGTERERKG